MKVIDNIQIRIKDIHIRFEDHYSVDSSYTCGLILRLFEVQTTNGQWVQKYIDRTQSGENPNLFKVINIEGFAFYLNPHDTFIIHQQTEDPTKRIQLMDALMSTESKLLQFILKPSKSI